LTHRSWEGRIEAKIPAPKRSVNTNRPRFVLMRSRRDKRVLIAMVFFVPAIVCTVVLHSSFPFLLYAALLALAMTVTGTIGVIAEMRESYVERQWIQVLSLIPGLAIALSLGGGTFYLALNSMLGRPISDGTSRRIGFFMCMSVLSYFVVLAAAVIAGIARTILMAITRRLRSRLRD
jgi:hypothetical protein